MSTQSVFGRILALLLAVAISLPAVAWADPAEEAADYYNQATTAYQSGEYKKAADLLDLAFGKNPDLVYKYNRILALQAAGDFDTALADLNSMYSPMKADGQSRFEDIDDIRAQLEASIAARDKANAPDPADQKDPVEQPDPADPTDPEPASGPNVLGIGLTAGGGAVLLTGVLFATGLFLPGGTLDCVQDRDCTDFIGDDIGTQTETEAFLDAKDAQKTQQVIAVSLMAGGAIIAGVGVVLLLTGNKKADTTTAGLDSLQFSPYFAQDGAGAAFQMRF